MRFQLLLSAIVCSACAEPTVRLLATAQDLEEGTELTATHLVEVKVSRALATSNAVRPEQASTLVGKRPRVALSKGDLVLASYFESDPALAALVTQRARSVTLSVSGAENLHAGDHVDLIAVVRDPQTNDFVAITLAQNVIVLDERIFRIINVSEGTHPASFRIQSNAWHRVGPPRPIRLLVPETDGRLIDPQILLDGTDGYRVRSEAPELLGLGADACIPVKPPFVLPPAP